MIKYGILPLNVIVGMLYIVTVGLALAVYKLANKPLRRFTQKQKSREDK